MPLLVSRRGFCATAHQQPENKRLATLGLDYIVVGVPVYGCWYRHPQKPARIPTTAEKLLQSFVFPTSVNFRFFLEIKFGVDSSIVLLYISPVKLINLLPLLFLLSCSKENNSEPVDTEDPKHVSANVVGQWKLIAETSSPAYDWNGDGTPETDRFAVYSNCEKERIFNFVQGGTGTADAAPAVTIRLMS